MQGKIFEKQEKLEEALGAFERTTIVNPKESDAFFEMGAIYEQRGERERALAAYKEPQHFRRTIRSTNARWRRFPDTSRGLDCLRNAQQRLAGSLRVALKKEKSRFLAALPSFVRVSRMTGGRGSRRGHGRRCRAETGAAKTARTEKSRRDALRLRSGQAGATKGKARRRCVEFSFLVFMSVSLLSRVGRGRGRGAG